MTEQKPTLMDHFMRIWFSMPGWAQVIWLIVTFAAAWFASWAALWWLLESEVLHYFGMLFG